MEETMNYDGVLAKIREAAEDLNEKADKASQHIADIEKKLIDAGVGINVWEDPFVVSHTADDHQSGWRRLSLGFARIEGEWGIAVRDVTKGGSEINPLAEERLLRKMGREMRVMATNFIPSLLQRILEDLNSTAEKLERTVELVKADFESLSRGKELEPESVSSARKEFIPSQGTCESHAEALDPELEARLREWESLEEEEEETDPCIVLFPKK
jgi:hypothetical protein